jgi:single-stranded-DNA-specific exonuclease
MSLQGAKYVWSHGPGDPGLVGEIAGGAGASDLLARVLVSRGIGSADDAVAFLRGGAATLPDAHLLPDADRVVERVARAIAAGETITVHGHDDADGVCASIVMIEALTQLGASASCYIPDRRTEGHGLNRAEIDRLAGEGVSLVVTVDSCVSDRDHIRYAGTLGIDVIVTDHHEIPPELPPAYAIVNPKLPGTDYPYRWMAGVGVALRVAELLRTELPRATPEEADRPWFGPRWIDEAFALAAIGSIADRVPLTGDNRTIVVEGLAAVARTERPGLRALLEESRLWGFSIEPDDVRESLSPMFGRLSDGRGGNEAYEVLVDTDVGEARGRARKLAVARSRWRQRALAAWHGVKSTIGSQVGGDAAALVVEAEIPVDVVGYVTSRLADESGMPAVVVARRDGTSMAEARGPRGFNLVTAFSSMHEIFIGYGGHPRAAGFSISNEKVGEFRRRMLEFAAENPPVTIERPIDAELPLIGATPDLARELDSLRPYGPGNGPAILLAKGVTGEDLEQARGGGLRFATPMTRLRSAVDLVYRLSHTDGTAFVHVIDTVDGSRAGEVPRAEAG